MATSRGITRALTAITIGLAAVALSGCSLLGNIIGSATHNGGATNSGSSPAAGNDTDVFTIKVGDCINDGGATGTVTSVPLINCAKPHDSEAYKSIHMTEDSFPGDDTVKNDAESGCTNAFETFAGIAYSDSKTLDFSYYYPTSDSWKGGDREILCLIYSYDAAGKPEKTTGSLEGAAR